MRSWWTHRAWYTPGDHARSAGSSPPAADPASWASHRQRLGDPRAAELVRQPSLSTPLRRSRIAGGNVPSCGFATCGHRGRRQGHHCRSGPHRAIRRRRHQHEQRRRRDPHAGKRGSSAVAKIADELGHEQRSRAVRLAREVARRDESTRPEATDRRRSAPPAMEEEDPTARAAVGEEASDRSPAEKGGRRASRATAEPRAGARSPWRCRQRGESRPPCPRRDPAGRTGRRSADSGVRIGRGDPRDLATVRTPARRRCKRVAAATAAGSTCSLRTARTPGRGAPRRRRTAPSSGRPSFQ